MAQIDKSDFVKIVGSIKDEIRTTQIRTMQQVNSNLIMMYFRIGKILSENSRYGSKFIDNVASEISLEFSGLKGFSVRNMKYMKRFYKEYRNREKTKEGLSINGQPLLRCSVC